MSRVYASLPLTGPQGPAGRELVRGAELALERLREPPAELVVLDSFEQGAAANARSAAQDGRALAYIGDFGSSDVLQSAPLLGEAGLLAVAPVATFAGLSGPTLVRLMPHDGVGARAIADWLAEAGVGEVLVLHDHDEGYGVPVGRMCVDAARERGLAVRSRPVWDHDEPPAADLGDAQAVLYVGVAGSGAAAMWSDLHELRPELWLLGTEGVAQEWLARELDPAAAERTRLFLAERAPYGFYGFEAMSLVLDSIEQAGNDRQAVVRAARGTRDRDSILGRYSIDADGHTTTTAYGRFAVAGGELVWDAG
ncbi:MAG: branched-chain amino acid transport system substrate-binding protein [Thermoleophilaceae bacterium]|jgi:branched-chain amino acid transport system substrate-binding protein|nr:branched-chain amino acid transport system substrate-binding protein [Thermoleophilaceae bacterium]